MSQGAKFDSVMAGISGGLVVDGRGGIGGGVALECVTGTAAVCALPNTLGPPVASKGFPCIDSLLEVDSRLVEDLCR